MNKLHLLAYSAASVFALSASSGAIASTGAVDGFGAFAMSAGKVVSSDDGSIHLARRGRGGDDHGSDDHGGDRDRSRGDDDSNDDHRGDRDRGDDDDDSNRRIRVPGGSGCDSAHDIAEHASCQG